MTGAADRLRRAIDASRAIGRRLELSIVEDGRWFPVGPEDLAGVDHDAIRARDAFLQRFGQATDHVLRKLFPRLQAEVTGAFEVLTVRELLEALHRIGVVDAPRTWMEFLEVRNRLIHDYALDPQELADSLNDAWRRAPILVRQIEAVAAFARDHRLLGD